MAEEILDGMFKADPVDAPADTVTPADSPAPVDPVPPADAPVTDAPQVVEQADPPVQEVPVESAPARPEPGYVPIAAVMDERDKRKALEARIAQFEAQQQRSQAPDPYDDPEGFQRYQGAQLQNALQQQKVDMSWAMAVDKYGEDDVQAAKAWATEKAQGDPIFMQQLDTAFLTQTLPINWLVQQHSRDQAMSKLGGKSLDDYVNEEIARRNASTGSAPVVAAPVQTAVAPVQQAPKPAAPPRSIASEASPTNAGPVDANAFWSFLDRK